MSVYTAPVPLADSTRLLQNQRVACRVYDGLAEVITLDEPVRQHRLNRVGTRIWELAERGVTVGELGERLAAQFEVDAARAREEARRFCEELLARGILVEEGAAS